MPPPSTAATRRPGHHPQRPGNLHHRSRTRTTSRHRRNRNQPVWFKAGNLK
nr:hypothetical protein [Methanobacterium sp. CWC-01]